MVCSRMTRVCSCCAYWTQPFLSRLEFQKGAGTPKPVGRTMSEPQCVPGSHSDFPRMTGSPSVIREGKVRRPSSRNPVKGCITLK
jgi:hypothetical protein